MATDWLNGAVTASLMSTTSCNIMCQFRLEQHLEMEMWADYKLPDNLCIDSAYMTDKNVQSCWGRMGQHGTPISIRYPCKIRRILVWSQLSECLIGSPKAMSA